MDKEYFDALAKVRMDRAKELLDDAADLLKKGFILPVKMRRNG